MNNLLIRQYQETKSKYLKLSGRLQRSYDTGEFYQLPGRKQNWLISRVKKLWEKLKMLEKQLKLAIAAGTITLLLTFSDGAQAQPNFILAPDKNPCPPPLVYGVSPIVNDVDLDGDMDILTTQSEDFIVWYKNVGTPSSPDFIKVPNDENPFTFPVYDFETSDIDDLADIDGDGDIDVFTDYYGTFYKNTGTAEVPVFEIETNPVGYLYGNLIDMDGDGDLDMVGLTYYYDYDPVLMEYRNIAKIRIYNNIGTPQVPNMDTGNPVLFDITNQPEEPSYWNSEVRQMDWGNDNDIDFLVKAELYNESEDDFFTEFLVVENTGNAQVPQFAFLSDEDNPFSVFITNGYDREIIPVDLDNDGDIDAFSNETNFGLTFYRNTGNNLVKDESLDEFNGFFFAPSYFTPPFLDFDGDGDLDMYTFTYEGETAGVYYENKGDGNNPEFTPTEDYFPFIQTSGSDYFFPLFVDIDSDGDLDCFVWYYVKYSGMLMDYYKNTGTQQSPNYQLDNYNNPVPVLEDMATMPSFADFDGDGDKDMIICTYYENEYSDDYEAIKYYRNTGDPGVPAFTLMEGTNNPFNGVDEVYGLYGSPLVIADLDMDGDFDVFFSDYYGNTGFRENIGTPTSPLFAINDAKNPLKNINTGYYGGFSLVDLDGDGDKDLFNTSLYNTLVTYYVNTDPRTSSFGNQHIIEGEFLKVYPNPASDYCILNLDGPSSGMCDLKIIDIHGQLMKSESFRKVNGHAQHQFDISGLVPGVYMINVIQGNHSYISRLIVE